VYHCSFNLPSRKEFNARHETFATSCHINYKENRLGDPRLQPFLRLWGILSYASAGQIKMFFQLRTFDNKLNWTTKGECWGRGAGLCLRGSESSTRFSGSPVLWISGPWSKTFVMSFLAGQEATCGGESARKRRRIPARKGWVYRYGGQYR